MLKNFLQDRLSPQKLKEMESVVAEYEEKTHNDEQELWFYNNPLVRLYRCLDQWILTFKDIQQIAKEYKKDNNFWIAYMISNSRRFGSYGEKYVEENVPSFHLASKGALRELWLEDSSYSQQFDLYYIWRKRRKEKNLIKIEVKSARILKQWIGWSRIIKGMTYDQAINNNNNQFDAAWLAIKPGNFDVMIWVLFFLDKAEFFVFNNYDLFWPNGMASTQHKGWQNNQLHITSRTYPYFEKFKVPKNKLKEVVKRKSGKY